jgi:hypothetical protein
VQGVIRELTRRPGFKLPANALACRESIELA